MEWFLYSWPALILLGIALRMALRLNYGARGPDPADPVYIFINTTSWVLFLLGLAPAVIVGGVSIFGVILILLGAFTLIEVVLARRAAQRRSMCTLLALSATHGGRLDSSLLLAGESTRGIVGRSMRKLANALGSGMPLAAAIMRYPRALPREAAAYVFAGESTDAQVDALRELARNDSSELLSVWRACVDRLAYLGSVLLAMTGIVAFLLIKIVPEFEKIFEEFDMQLPPITTLMISVSNSATNTLAPLALLVVFGIIASLIVGICYLCDWPVLQWISDRALRARHAASIMRILALATDHRQPLVNVLTRLSKVYPSVPIRRQLETATRSIQSGDNWLDSFRNVRLISATEQTLLASAEKVGNLPWILRVLADRSQRRTAYRVAALVQVLYPLAILLLAAIIGFYVVGLFIPLVSLIQALA